MNERGATVKGIPVSEPMSVEVALLYASTVEWRLFRPRADRAAIALAAEVGRLQAAVSEMACEALSLDGQNMELSGELERIRAAAPEIIKCSNVAGCRERDYPWAGCCLVRAAFIELGLLEAGAVAEQGDDDGA